METNTSDFLIIGGGVIGINLALQAKRRYPDASVTLIEKESSCGTHASGRNSGVLHAGFYYTADSLKARLTRDGNRQLSEYCLERGLGLNRCGKLVVAKNDSELPVIYELLARARRNGVELYEVSESEAREIEPRVRFHGRALFSSATASVDPTEVMEAFVSDARDAGIRILTRTKYLGRGKDGVNTNQGQITAGYVINAAGLYADRIAKDFGFAKHYRILPFKGLYLYANEAGEPLRTNVYPVPDLRNPFLGVHHTVTLDGRSKIGPTAIPSFWREHYSGLANFRLDEFLEIVGRETELFIRNDFDFRRLAWEEMRKTYRPRIVALAGELVTGVRTEHYTQWGEPGIRAQLLDTSTGKLEMDFRIEGDDQSFHVLNAVSPAFTCSISFGEYAFEQIAKLIIRG
ncbi:MAG: L-2-hydroxyglutarate oxidase [Pseudomonadota bacterium]|nr:L-2-hydroxyglutarate oxidase [Pseudomonadota bacterium]